MKTPVADSTLFEQGIDMMLYGMGTVFVFLVALVLAIVLMSRLLGKFFPESPDIEAGVPATAIPVKPLTRKIIQAAIDSHRGR